MSPFFTHSGWLFFFSPTLRPFFFYPRPCKCRCDFSIWKPSYPLPNKYFGYSPLYFHRSIVIQSQRNLNPLITAIIFIPGFYRITPKQFIPGCIAEVWEGKRIIGSGRYLKVFSKYMGHLFLFCSGQANKKIQYGGTKWNILSTSFFSLLVFLFKYFHIHYFFSISDQ